AINFAYQSAGGGYDNSELTSLSSQTGASDKEDEMGSAGSDRPMNRFELIVGPQTVSPDNARIESARLQSATDALLPDTENLGR
ncbi:MAG: hypothetical protein OEM60_13375, partial [Gammaproteobacteria bacterium]|nr:hypothetical protein [Gammaproteobacteria bacterium]